MPAAPPKPTAATWWSFTTIPPASELFFKLGPVNTAVNVSLLPTLSWTTSSGAITYEFCYDTVNDSACAGSWVSTGATTSATISGLTTSTTYYWQARAVNPGGTTYADSGLWWSFTTVPPAPGAFAKTSPVNAAVNVPLAPVLTWGSSAGAVSYQYCYDTIDNNACNATWISAGANTTVTLSGLTTSTTYYWQVRAVNTGGTTYANVGAWWSFSTVPPPPAAFAKTSPANTAINISLSPTLSWGASSGAASYEYCYDTIDNNICNATWTSTGTATTAGLSGLSTSTTYFWQVRATNPGGTTEANAASWWSFTTVPPAPGAFSKVEPANAAVNVALAPMLSWGSSSNAVSYEYCYDTSNDSACAGSWISAGSNTSVVLGSLATSATYYWQVRAVNPGGTTYANTSTWWSFSTVPPAPGVFAKSSPANGATNTSLAPTLSWGASSGAVSYEYCIDTSIDSTCAGSWISTGSNLSVVLDSLTTSTTYNWQVRAVNPGGTTYANSGTWWTFTTVPPAPGAFTKLTPSNAAVNLGLTPTLTWSGSSGATTYEYCVDTSNDSTCAGSWISAGSNLSVVLGSLTYSTTYYWQVRAVNPGGTTFADGSSWWSFSTMPPAPGSFGKTSPTNGAAAQPTSLTLTWEASTGAASYEYCYDTSGDNSCIVWTTNGTSTSKALSGLSEGTTYYWHVRAINPGGTTYANAASTAFWSFTTLVTPPGAFDKVSPANGATGLSTSPTLTWSASSGAASYEYCYDTSGDNTCAAWTSNGTVTSKTLSGLE